MLYPANITEKLNIQYIFSLLKSYCKGTKAIQYIEQLKPLYQLDEIIETLEFTNEFKQLIEEGTYFPDKNFISIDKTIAKVDIESNFLELDELVQLKLFLKTFIEAQTFFKRENKFVRLSEKLTTVSIDPQLYKNIHRVIDDSGTIRDQASDVLQKIREELILERGRLRKEVERLLRTFKKEGYIVDDAEATIRSGRLVLPILAEHKRKIQGIIHDESGTGQTAFMEPISLIHSNNAVRELELSERKEIIRILIELTTFIKTFVEPLLEANELMGWVDFVRAKAILAIEWNAVVPKMVNEPMIQWYHAKHPLLLLKEKQGGRKVVPLNISLSASQRIVVLSGPNAGGKSVCMKTVGMLQYLLQSGLMVPMDEQSTCGLFKEFFIDIGDSQSLENDLSTYSSHIKNLTYFITHATQNSLLLIDEFGSGTDPVYGSSVAEAVLETLNAKKVFGIVTTHYSGLKVLASHVEGLVNASMRFDVDRLEPLYEFQPGVPGSSFTLEIAEKSGLPMSTIRQAESKLTEEQLSFTNLIKEVEHSRELLANKQKEAEATHKANVQLQHEWNQRLSDWKLKRQRLMIETKEKSMQLLAQAEQKIQLLIDELKQQSVGSHTGHVKQKLKNIAKEIQSNFPEQVEVKPSDDEGIKEDWKIGDYAKVYNSDTVGKIESIKDKKVVLLVGSLSMHVALKDLRVANAKAYKSQMSSQRVKSNIDINEKHAQFKLQLDVRGLRSEEAISKVDQWFNDALIIGASQLSILHGKGDGILRTMIRFHLSQYKQIKQMADEHVDRGGAGITIIHL